MNNKSNNILLCFGTRPEAIKMAPIYFQLKKSKYNVKVCVTAQHRTMLDQVLDFFEIVPDYDLNIMKANQSLNELFGNIVIAFHQILVKESFNLVLVHGDTTTSTAVALASFQAGIKVGHIEAGLRTYHKLAPFPEEINRQLTSKLADFHFAPTPHATNNLVNEGIPKASIITTGNTVIDALQLTVAKIEQGYTNTAIQQLQQQLHFDKKIILVTGHRRENFGEGFQHICKALHTIAQRTDVEIVYPVHLNPNVRKTVFAQLSNQKNIHLIEPLDYPAFVWLMHKASLIISDSGGVQEEAPTLKVPVLVTRNVTERAEGLAQGFSALVGTDTDLIIKKATEYLDIKPEFKNCVNPYGDGKAAKKIVEFLDTSHV